MKQVSVPSMLTQKMGNKRVPHFVVRYLQHIVHEQEMNAFLSRVGDVQGLDFLHAVLSDALDIRVRAEHAERIPQGENPVIFVSNHPLGGADGLLLIDLLTRYRGERVRVIVNDILMAMEPLRTLFVPVNKVGAQTKAYALQQRALWESSMDVLTFPAGMCSRRMPDGSITDLAWKDHFVRRAKEYHRDIVPLYFEGYNSNFFYRLAQWRKRLGIKVNIEMLYLADEMFKARGKEFVVRVGRPIPWEMLDDTRSTQQWTDFVRNICYNELKNETNY